MKHLIKYAKILISFGIFINFTRKLGIIMEIGKHTGLVLEGGGMRGVFTCGV
ncbi:MAG TPA: patatin family protein, partial [Paraprevotella xylaniphila]|nr:patatin family protein [Paraprevotella xylaniphila]